MESSPLDLAGALVEQIEVGVIILDQELRILHWNEFVSQRSGKVLGPALRQPLTAVFPETDTPRLGKMVARARDQGLHAYTHWREDPYLIQLPYSPEGQVTPLRLQSTLLFPFDCGGERCLGLLLYDTTEFARSNEQLAAALNALGSKQLEQEQLVHKLEKANAQLLQSEKLAAIGQLAAGVAHEINNPIGYVFSNLKTLTGYVNDLLRIVDAVDGVGSLEELQQLKRSLEYDYIRNDVEALIHESEDGIERVKKIITALKDFSHIEEEEFRAADLHKGFDSTLNLVNNELKYKAEVVRDYGELPLVECIPSQINQVVMNLLINAAHAIESFGRICLRSGQQGDWVWLEVEDNGKGIDPAILNRIYEPFFTTKPVGKGTGLGLALSYNIVQKHNGRIEVVSQPGHGTRFRVWLPRKQPLPGGTQA
ncbi:MULTISPECIES: ATP-binding protein [unclassified Pseudomonas]|jgi:signal transduction histidine kinase|uniref:ATP-binding protein n=1 Tax=unclassified Pseudomonas TaxID=196821 RepID=UPI000EA9F729|nr:MULTISPECIES: ATP-binding protein [unclassified Pseudomonas]AYF86029.1 ATP-binding protein [Pseudomonas sp. DY-1]MDH4651940.1 ATP-binding protein [Pseudomonas sp. BN606]MRK24428.1 ATP-binding protein [Pseudomonas sp. JG-B]